MELITPDRLAAQLSPGDAFVVGVAGQWTFFAEQIVGGQNLGPLQVTDCTFSRQLNGYGTGSITLAVAQTSLTAADMLRLWSWKVWISYAGHVMWCGVPTGLEDDGSATVTLTLSEISAYLHERVYDTATTYTQVEQTQIARDLAAPLADVGVHIVTEPGPGFLRDRDYAYLEGQDRAELLTNLANVINGPEFRTEYATDPTTAAPSATLRIVYPRVGSGASGLGITVPGDAVDFSLAWDSDKLRTRTFAVGDLPEGADQSTQKPVVITDRPQPGLPRLDRADDWPGTVLLSTLTERSQSAAATYATPAVEVEATTFESAPELGSYGLGDDVVVSILDPLLPDGLTTTARLTAMSVDCVAGTVKWTVATTQPPAQPRSSLTARLARLDAQQTATFHANVGEPS